MYTKSDIPKVDRLDYTQAPNYNRRQWLQLTTLSAGALMLPVSLLGLADKRNSYTYHLGMVQKRPFSFPPDKTVPFNWPVAELIASGNPILIKWDKKIKQNNKELFFRITSATDVREECTLEVTLASNNTKIGELDIRFAHYMQPFEISVHPGLLPEIISEGVSIKMIKGTKPFWFFVEGPNGADLPDAYLPHLLLNDLVPNRDAWKSRLLSLSSLSTFGWMEGCVLDGIGAFAENNIGAKKILRKHLSKYFGNDSLAYENLMNQRSSGKITSVESILPFAMLAREYHGHPMLNTAIDFCIDHANAEGVIADGIGSNRRLKTEECYTISYPLATLAKLQNRPDLERMAIASLQARVTLLTNHDFIFQNGLQSGERSFGNWARGVGWHLLGLAKSLAELPVNAQTDGLRTAFQRNAEIAIRHQQASGLWSCFLHQHETGIETSGSASIGAGLAYGYSKKLLPVRCRDAAEKCAAGLESYYTPDGFLKGTSQVNKGGDELQQNGFRVISPYTLGFIAILKTSLKAK